MDWEETAYLDVPATAPGFSAGLTLKPRLSSTRKRARRLSAVLYSGVKRVLDLILSVILLIVLSPLFLLISLLVKKDSNGPVFFKQLRTGKNGQDFYIYKFRTMNAKNDIHDKSTEDEHTKVGSFLRSTSLDELPQLINVLKGEMSFIGPRPWITNYYRAMNERERTRYSVKPGITGLAQAKGRNGITIFQKIDYDLQYIDNYSLTMDFYVLVASVRAVFGRKNADAGKWAIHSEIDELKAENSIPVDLFRAEQAADFRRELTARVNREDFLLR